MKAMRRAAWFIAVLAVASLVLVVPCFALNNPTVSSVTTTTNSQTVNWTWTSGGSGTFKNWNVLLRRYDSPTAYTQMSSVNAGTDSALRTYTRTAGQNVKWSFAIQALATSGIYNSAVSAYVTKYTLANTPDSLTIGTVTTDSVGLTTGATAGLLRLDWDQSGIIFAANGTDLAKVQALTTTATGLTSNTEYTFKAKAVNGDGVETAYGPEDTVFTLADKPVFDVAGAGAVNSAQGNAGGSFLLGQTFSFDAVNGIGAGAGKASSYNYLWDTSSADPVDWAGAGSWTDGTLAITPVEVGTYYLHLVALNGDAVMTAATTSAGYEVAAVPEPGSIVAAFGLLAPLGLVFRRRRRG